MPAASPSTLNNHSWLQQWTHRPVQEILAGMVGTFALIPEVIAFSYVAGVAPAVSLFASFILSVSIAFLGGRPGMITGAAGSVALVVAPLVHNHGVQYMFLATMLAGLFQVLFGLLRLQEIMRFVSSEVQTGFVNALAILIFSAQLPQIFGVNWHNYILIALGLAIIYLLPRISTIIPSPLICIIALTALTIWYPMPVRVVADLGELPTGLPHLTWPHLPWSWHTLAVILPYALAMAAVGLLESLMTANVVDELTDTHSAKQRECTGLGLSNILAGLFGGIGGCGMIGQTVGNLRYGGRGRLSTFTAGAFLLLLMVVLHQWVARVPMAALVAIMIMVSISTFSWGSLSDLFHHPKLSSLVMLMTVIVTLLTHDLAAGVLVGVLLSGVFFAWQTAKLVKIQEERQGETLIYHISGQFFFASATMLHEMIDVNDAASKVILDLSDAHFWDITAQEMLEKIIAKLRRHNKLVEINGLNKDQHHILKKFSQDSAVQENINF